MKLVTHFLGLTALIVSVNAVCSTDSDCTFPFFTKCNSLGVCVVPVTGVTCRTTGDCTSPQVCDTTTGVCTANPFPAPCPTLFQCINLPDTPVCDSSRGRCVSEGVVCADDDDCTIPSLGKCNSGRCASSVRQIVDCLDDEDCASVPDLPVCSLTSGTCIGRNVFCDGPNDCQNPEFPECDLDICLRSDLSGPALCDRNDQCSVDTPICNPFTSTCVKRGVVCVGQSDCTDTSRSICNTDTYLCVSEPCTGNADCVAADPATPVCTSGQCVKCSLSTECDTDPSKPICDPSPGTCAACTDNNECSTRDQSRPFCNTNTGACQEQASGSGSCGTTADCTSTEFPICDGSNCVRCATNGQCSSKNVNTPICGTSGSCGPCSSNTQCPSGTECRASGACEASSSTACTTNSQCATADPDKPVCSAGQCVACTDSSQCNTASSPICDGGNCRACATDNECSEKNFGEPFCLSTGACIGPCTSSSDCSDPTRPICDFGNCRACANNNECDAKDSSQPFCLGTGVCSATGAGCTSTGCSDPTRPDCNTNTGGCGCTSSSNCPVNTECNTNSGVCEATSGPACTASSQCNTASSPICAGGNCRACANNDECETKDGTRPFCTDNGACTAGSSAGTVCGSNADCTTAGQLFCDGVESDPGLCLASLLSDTVCTDNEACENSARFPFCDLTTERCFGQNTCTSNRDCTASLPTCDNSLCVDEDIDCTSDEQCDNPFLTTCDTEAGICVPEPPPQCDDNDDCTTDGFRVCGEQGVCIQSVISQIECSDSQPCDPSSDFPFCDADTSFCFGPFSCNDDGDCGQALPKCIPTTGVCEQGPISCERTSDCLNDFYQFCVNNVCRPAECVLDENCGDTEVCLNGGCVPAENECNFSDECEENEICEAGRCVANVGECVDDGDCDTPGLPRCVRSCQFRRRNVDGTGLEARAPGDCTPGVCSPRICSTNAQCTETGFPRCFENNCRPARCEADRECTTPGFDKCVQGACVQCRSNSDCDASEVCEASGVCVTVTEEPECSDDLDCTDSDKSKCVQGSCYECAANDDCESTENPRCILGSCGPAEVECANDGDCNTPGLPICNNGECVAEDGSCTSNDDCVDPLPICNPATGECEAEDDGEAVGCSTNDDCPNPSAPVCDKQRAICVAPDGFVCGDDDDCINSELPDCDVESGLCVPAPGFSCDSDSDCVNPLLPICDLESGQCQVRDACSSNADCTNPLLPVCDVDTGICNAGPSSTATNTGTATSATASSTATGNPDVIAGTNFGKLGCFTSIEGVSGFDLNSESDDMDLDLCAERCEGQDYFGTYVTQCFCGANVEGNEEVEEVSCDLECPGNSAQFCGGNATPDRLAKRQAPSTDILLSIYAALDLLPPGGGGDASTVTTTFVSTVTEASGATVTTITSEVICINGRCTPGGTGPSGPIFVLEPFPCGDCSGQSVYVPRPCSCPGGVEYVPRLCDDSSCKGVSVFKPKETEYREGLQVFQPEDCAEGDCETAGKIFRPSGAGEIVKPSEGGKVIAEVPSGNKVVQPPTNVGANNLTEHSGPGKVPESLADKQMVTTLALVVLLPMMLLPALLG